MKRGERERERQRQNRDRDSERLKKRQEWNSKDLLEELLCNQGLDAVIEEDLQTQTMSQRHTVTSAYIPNPVAREDDVLQSVIPLKACHFLKQAKSHQTRVSSPKKKH